MPKLKGKTYAYTKKGKEAYKKALMKKKKRTDAKAQGDKKGSLPKASQDQEFRRVERVRTTGAWEKDKKGREYPFMSHHVNKKGQPISEGDAMLGRKKYPEKKKKKRTPSKMGVRIAKRINEMYPDR
jgi:hypothetical protein